MNNRFGYSRYVRDIAAPEESRGFDLTSLGLPSISERRDIAASPLLPLHHNCRLRQHDQHRMALPPRRNGELC